MRLTGQQIIRGQRMLDHGAKWADVVRELDSTWYDVQMALKPGYHEKRLERDRARVRHHTRKPRPSSGPILGHSHGVRSLTPAEAAQALASVPVDTRDLTARLLGDPLPGRSALDRAQAQTDHMTPFHPVFPANNTISILGSDTSINPVAPQASEGARA